MSRSRINVATVKTQVAAADAETFNEIRDGYYKQAEGLMGLIDGLKSVMSNATGDQKDELEEAIATLVFAEEQIESLQLGTWI